MTVHGTPAASVATFAAKTPGGDARTAAGERGELIVAEHLNTWAAGNPTAHVFHDLYIEGRTANIDHLVVIAGKLLVVDAKMWAPGRYWTLAGTTRHGRRKTSAHTDVEAVTGLLDALIAEHSDHDVSATLAICTRRGSTVNVTRYQAPDERIGAVKVTGLGRYLSDWAAGVEGEADPAVIRKFSEACTTPGQR